MKTLSIIIPAYNEEKTIGDLLKIILELQTEPAGFKIEIIVVDDGSSDSTFSIANKFPAVKCIRQQNSGKGSAVQTGIKSSTGDYVLIQDADMEYNPHNYFDLLNELKKHGGMVSIYGSRVLGYSKNKRTWLPSKHEKQGIGPYVANVLLTLLTFLLYGKWITDTLTAYKLYPAEIIKRFQIKSRGFEADHEITAKLIKSKVRIIEVPIEYNPRSKEEGKKITAKDGLIACMTFIKYRFIN